MITFANASGKFELEVTTFQMAILFCWNDRPGEELSFESIRLATQLPDTELRRTLWVRIPSLHTILKATDISQAKMLLLLDYEIRTRLELNCMHMCSQPSWVTSRCLAKLSSYK